MSLPVFVQFSVAGVACKYIVSQGPMEHTCTDFWQMIWEQSVSIILMLTNEVVRIAIILNTRLYIKLILCTCTHVHMVIFNHRQFFSACLVRAHTCVATPMLYFRVFKLYFMTVFSLDPVVLQVFSCKKLLPKYSS